MQKGIQQQQDQDLLLCDQAVAKNSAKMNKDKELNEDSAPWGKQAKKTLQKTGFLDEMNTNFKMREMKVLYSNQLLHIYN